MNKSWDDTEAKVKQILKEKLNLANDPDMEGAHRSCRQKTWRSCFKSWLTEAPENHRMSYTRLETKGVDPEKCMIKPVGLFVKEDLAPATIEKREELQPKLIAAKRAGKIAYFVLDKLVIRDRPAAQGSRQDR